MTESSPKPGRRWWLIPLVLIVAWIGYLAAFGPERPDDRVLGPPRWRAPQTPRRTDYRWTLRDLDDAPVDFAKYRGRVVFLNLWATWCPPCLEELPSITNLADNRRLKDVAFLCVSTDESAATLRDFVRDKRWAMTVLRATELPEALFAKGLPTTFVIASDGEIVAVEEGPAQWDDPSAVDRLEALAKGSPAGPTSVKP